MGDRSEGRHRAEQYRSPVAGIEAIALSSDRSFPRHAHDHFGIGVLGFGAHRSWSGVGAVEAVAGDVITVNPGEMHDGHPVRGQSRSWHMLYLDPAIVTEAVRNDMNHVPEFTLPALRDPTLAARFARLFAAIVAPAPDRLAVEEGTVSTLAHMLARYGCRPLSMSRSPPAVAQALRRMDEAPEMPVTLTELAALAGTSRFQLLRGFSRHVGITPHAYLLQCRVRLAKRLLATGGRPADVAAAAGFADQSHLTRAFGRQFGITPAQYRAALA